MTDPIDRAVAAVEASPPIAEQRTQAQISLLGRRDRVALLNLPADVSDLELLALFGAILQIGDGLRAQRPASRIVGPNGAPVGG